MTLLQRVITWAQRAWSASRASALAPKPGLSAGLSSWTDVDKRVWSAFLASDTGRRLWSRFHGAELSNYRTQCGDPSFAAHSSGRARGFTDAREWLESLSRVTCVVVTPANSEADFSEPDSPRAEGEPDLTERLSP